MSISNLFVPNNYTLYADQINASNSIVPNATVTNLTVSQLFSPGGSITIVPSGGDLVVDSDIKINFGKRIQAQGYNLILDSTTSLVELGVGLIFPTTGDVPSPMTFYKEDTTSITFGGPFVNQALNVYLTRLNKVVTLSIPILVGAWNSVANPIVSTTGIPAVYRPSHTISRSVNVQTDNVVANNSFGVLTVNSSGIIQISSNGNSASGFTGTGTQNVGMPSSCTVTFNILA
jgi:hypothetical protein